MRPRSLLRWSALVVAVAAATGAGWLFDRSRADAADAAPDFSFFREKIEPVLQSVCAQCHAGKGKGQFALIVHAAGIDNSEAESRVNFATVSKLLVAGKPEQSKFLQKPLSEKGGGVKHGGNERIFRGTSAYKAWTDFINGVKGAASMAAAPSSAPGQPDLGYFVARIEPVLLGVCAQCHAGAGKGQFALVTHVGGTRFPLADHQKNFETVKVLLVPGKPEQSRFLLKPLSERDGGVKHGGGDRISKGDDNYKSWVEFIQGVKGPPVPAEPPPEPELPTVADQGLVLQVEDMKIEGDASASPMEGGAGKAVAPGAAGGRATVQFRASRRGEYTIQFRAGAAYRGFRIRVDGGEPLAVEPPKSGVADVAPVLPLDDGKALDGRLGKLVVEGSSLAMDGREGTARWLSPADLPHTRVDATVVVPAGDDVGRDDAWLLFDCLDQENGKFFGLGDGGRKLVMGVLESGRPRIVASKPAPALAPNEPVSLAVDLLDGVAVGRLGGKPVLAANFDRQLGAARFGFLTHGIVTVREMTAHRGAEEVHRLKLGTGSVFHLTKGSHTLQIELLPQGAAIDAVTVKEVAP